jgi:hypothetical protein
MKLFYAKMLGLEERCVDAASGEEARELVANGGGHRCWAGESGEAELAKLLDE